MQLCYWLSKHCSFFIIFLRVKTLILIQHFTQYMYVSDHVLVYILQFESSLDDHVRSSDFNGCILINSSPYGVGQAYPINRFPSIGEITSLSDIYVIFPIICWSKNMHTFCFIK